MNYKEMLDKFEYLEHQIKHLELENRYLKERVAKLEGNHWFTKPMGPQFTPGTLPQYNTVTCSNSQYGDH